MRISSIDIGSNAIRQVIVEVNPHGQWTTLKKFRAPLRLGADVFSLGKISDAMILEMIQVFKKMAKLEKKFQCRHSIALATSAMRDAKNKAVVLRKIKAASQIKVQIISGHTEATLIQQAIFKSNIINDPRVLLLDIGGGSAEYTFLENEKILSTQSFPLGVVRLKKLTHEKTENVQALARKYFRKMHVASHLNKVDCVIGTGGNFDALSKLKVQLLKKTPSTHLSATELKQIKNIWQKLSLEKKMQLKIRQDRIDVLDYAIELIQLTMNEFQIQKIKIPMTGLKEGAIHSVLTNSLR